MKIFNKKNSIFILLVFFSFGGVYFLQQNEKIERKVAVEQIRTEPLTNEHEVSSHNKTVNEAPSFVAEETIPLKDYQDDWCHDSELNESSKELADLEYYAWAKSRNHSLGDRRAQVETYKHYDSAVLKTLGEQGDLIALSALVGIRETPVELKEWAARSAAMFGGTGDAMSYFSATNKGVSKALMRSGQKDEAKKVFLESVAWDEFTAMRGDISLLENIAFILSFDEMKELEITEEDEEWISSRAREIYTELSNERKSRGLGEFDNSVPRVVEIENAGLATVSLRYKGVSEKWYSKYYPPSDCFDKKN